MKPMTDEELREFADEHLYYEIEMALFAGPLALRYANPASVEEQVIKNALLESFVTHIRVLKEFFYDERGRPDDVIADDYVDDPEAWHQARGPLPEVLARAARRTGKGVVHLTRGRVVAHPSEKEWVPAELIQALTGPLQQFVALVPRHRLNWKFQMLVSDLGKPSE